MSYSVEYIPPTEAQLVLHVDGQRLGFASATSALPHTDPHVEPEWLVALSSPKQAGDVVSFHVDSRAAAEKLFNWLGRQLESEPRVVACLNLACRDSEWIASDGSRFRWDKWAGTWLRKPPGDDDWVTYNAQTPLTHGPYTEVTE